MKDTQLSGLETIADVGFQKQFQTLRPILEAEVRIQHQLAKLDHQLDQMRKASGLTEGYQISGGDILWRGWESATRRALNMRLAQTRAQKLAGMEALRIAFGRKQAVATLREQQLKSHRQAVARKQTR